MSFSATKNRTPTCPSLKSSSQYVPVLAMVAQDACKAYSVQNGAFSMRNGCIFECKCGDCFLCGKHSRRSNEETRDAPVASLSERSATYPLRYAFCPQVVHAHLDDEISSRRDNKHANVDTTARIDAHAACSRLTAVIKKIVTRWEPWDKLQQPRYGYTAL